MHTDTQGKQNISTEVSYDFISRLSYDNEVFLFASLFYHVFDVSIIFLCKALVDMVCDDTAAFFGPEGPDCSTEAMVAGSKNRAIITYNCADAKILSNTKNERYPTFTRMEPPNTQVQLFLKKCDYFHQIIQNYIYSLDMYCF